MRKLATLSRVQALSGLAFFVFAAGHFANTMLAAFSAELYDAYQARTRALYQYPVIEIGLLLALSVHIATGVVTARARRGQPPATGMARLHRYAGRTLAVVILGHVAFTRGPSLFAGVYPESIGIAYSIVRLPAVSYPYFAILIACGLLHAGYGVWKAALTLADRAPIASPPRALALAVVLGIGLAWLGILGLGGQLYAIKDPARSQFAALVERLMDSKPAATVQADSQKSQPVADSQKPPPSSSKP